MKLQPSPLITVMMLSLALLLDLKVVRYDADAHLAAELLGECDVALLQQEVLNGLPVFSGNGRHVLFFRADGKQGEIRGAIVVHQGMIERVEVQRSRDGIRHRELQSPTYLAAFCGQPAQSPIVVDGVSGATVSSQIMLDAINHRLKLWRTCAMQ